MREGQGRRESGVRGGRDSHRYGIVRRSSVGAREVLRPRIGARRLGGNKEANKKRAGGRISAAGCLSSCTVCRLVVLAKSSLQREAARRAGKRQGRRHSGAGDFLLVARPTECRLVEWTLADGEL